MGKTNDIDALIEQRFPRAAGYDRDWLVAHHMGPCAVWLAEWLCEALELKPGMRVLDMGCGKALTSIFLAKEFGVEVWANDLWISASENWQRIQAAGVEDRVFPLQIEAHALPFADSFFDAAVSIDAYHYFGTDDLYLGYFARFIKPGGTIGIVVPAVMQEIGDAAPDHLTQGHNGAEPFWEPEACFSLHTAAWWRRHWTRPQVVDVQHADTLEDGWRYWLRWSEILQAAGADYIDDPEAIRIDAGRYIGFARVVAQRKMPT